MATDIYTPSLSFLIQYFHASKDKIALTLSLYLLGFSFSSLIYGPLSDSLGRRRVLLGWLSLFVIGTLACALSPSIHWLVFMRILQGVGAGVVGVLGGAIIKDLYDGNECARVFSSMDIAAALSPVIAPIIGGYLTVYWGWQWSFIFIFCFGLALLLSVGFVLKETLAIEKRQTLSIKSTLYNYFSIVKNKKFLSYSLGTSFSYGGFWAYISITPFYFTSELGYSISEYGYFQALLVGPYVFGALANRQLLGRFSIRRMLSIGILILTIGSISLLVVTIYCPRSAYAISWMMAINSFGLGIVFPNAATYALELFPNKTGSASAILSFLDMLIASFSIWIAGTLYVNNFLPVAVFITATSIVAAFALRHVFYLTLRKISSTSLEFFGK